MATAVNPASSDAAGATKASPSADRPPASGPAPTASTSAPTAGPTASSPRSGSSSKTPPTAPSPTASSARPGAKQSPKSAALAAAAAAATAAAGKKAAAAVAAEAPREPLDPMRVILQAVENCKPLMKVRSNKLGAKIVFIPKVVDPREQRSLAIRWIVQAAEKRHEAARSTPFSECLASELLLAYQRKGGARQKRDDLHRVALENRANVARS